MCMNDITQLNIITILFFLIFSFVHLIYNICSNTQNINFLNKSSDLENITSIPEIIFYVYILCIPTIYIIIL